MLRRIVIRQAFVWIDLSLAILFMATAGLVVYAVCFPATLHTAETPKFTSHHVGNLPAPGPAKDYTGIEIFGATKPPDPPQPPTTAPQPPGPTPLDLKLIGTTHLPEDRFASAVIQSGEAASPSVYLLGDTIMDNVTLVDIGNREVYILNDIGGKNARELLSMELQEQPAMAKAVQTTEPQPSSAPSAVQHITLDRADLMKKVTEGYHTFSTLKPELARDKQGNVIGLTASNVGQVSLARELGLGDGDILQSVNNEPIDSEQKLYESIFTFQNAASIRIGVLSGGKPKVITYRLK